MTPKGKFNKILNFNFFKFLTSDSESAVSKKIYTSSFSLLQLILIKTKLIIFYIDASCMYNLILISKREKKGQT